ncbi:hypothetical protein [Streptomyces cyanogenus]|uniref:Uncharacterized protein n=1 Tax=Streptomyces cyanogenus TaxID=80860 RepID=A0ABX7U218_STRCY|nr:hypothetical protein [Streptomyces cyanogenus]QTE02817.1 hypothetical protein S1361_36125 [Streptomyces cyanogenus]
MNDFPPVHQDPAPDRYGRLRVRADDLSPADWLTARGPGPAAMGTVAGVAAPGFAAYARILHPARLGERPVRWSTVAAAQGTRITPVTRWHEVIGADPDHVNRSDLGLPGVWDEHPGEGPTPPEVARALLPVLARHTGTAQECWFGLWSGYGRWDWERFPTFETPGRDEVLLAGRLADAVSPVSLDEFAELPGLWWPQDRAWCLGGDVDLASTYVGGSPELIADLLAAPDLEACPVHPDDPVG